MIETDRLLLRKPRLEDAEALVEVIGDPETMRYIGDGSTGDLAAAELAIEKWLVRWEESGIGQFVVERRTDGRLVGRAGFLVWDPEIWEPAPSGEVEIGWTLARSCWGHGYATEAALALRDWTDRRRLISLIQHGNERSVRVAEKLGERYERDVEVRGMPTRLFALER
ncbi:MAG TPA: GNAT family N-acetyltransferase [Gaiellaceae bacterium]|nr:GNAT family N-acetyltransferase [Gaiellaceae bacterium]